MPRKDLNSRTFRGAGAFFTALVFSSDSLVGDLLRLFLDLGKPIQVLRTRLWTVLDANRIAAACPKPLRVLKDSLANECLSPIYHPAYIHISRFPGGFGPFWPKIFLGMILPHRVVSCRNTDLCGRL